MIRIVCDTMIYLQALANPKGPAGRTLASAYAGKLELLMTSQTLDEVHELLYRPKLRKKFLPLTDEEVEIFYDSICKIATQLDWVPRIFNLPRYPKDEKYLNLAIASKVPYLATRDNDLLDLMKDESFRTTYPNLEILGPDELLCKLQILVEHTSMLNSEQQAEFERAASAYLANSEIIEAVASGGIDRSPLQMNTPDDSLFWVLHAISTSHPALKGIAFRGWIFLLPEIQNPIPRAVREATILRL